MKNFIAKTLITALSVFFIAWLLPGVSIEESYVTAIVVALVISLLNASLKPLLVILTLPATILTLGLFMWVINAVVVLATAAIVPSFIVANFWWALLFSALLSFINSFMHNALLPKTERAAFTHTRHKRVTQNKSATTVSGNEMEVENGKKTIIIEKE